MKPSEFLKQKAGSLEQYYYIWGTKEIIPKEMDEKFVDVEDINKIINRYSKV